MTRTDSVNHQLSIHLTKITIRLTAEQSGKMPHYSGSVWRGMLGKLVRQKSCIIPSETCGNCAFMKTCAYGSIFEPTSEMFAQEMAGNRKSLTPPLVVEAPFFKNGFWKADEKKEISLLFLGDYFKYIHYFIDSIKELVSINGVGPDRIRCQIDGIFQETMDGKRHPLSTDSYLLDDIFFEKWTWRQYGELPGHTTLLLKFITPTRIQKQGKTISSFDLGAFIDTCARRAEYATALYGKPVKYDSVALEEVTNAIEITENNIRWQDWDRFSSKQKKAMNLGGLVGEVEMKGKLDTLLQLLQLCAAVHIGKQTVFGLGKFDVYIKL